MENQIYRLTLSGGYKLELCVVNTNETNPIKDIKEMGVRVFDNEVQLDGGLDVVALDSLILYLQNCRDYINGFNVASKPREENGKN